jgi:hypothetical protein
MLVFSVNLKDFAYLCRPIKPDCIFTLTKHAKRK